MIQILILILIPLILFGIIYNKKAQGKSFVKKIEARSQFTAAKHQFQPFTQKGFFYCNACDGLIGGFFSLQAQSCIKCGIIVHNLCRYKRKQQCKSITNKSFKHEYVEGNMPINTLCSICELSCVSYLENKNFRCLWCQRAVHNECKEKLGSECDCGSLKNAIIKPNEIEYVIPQTRGQKLIQLIKNSEQKIKNKLTKKHDTSEDTETDTEYLKKQSENWILTIDNKKTPIVVVINKKSGGQLGIEYMKEFYKFLNPIQIIDLLEDGLDRLKVFRHMQKLKIVVGGGDGTVASIVNSLRNGEIQEWENKNPPVAVLALGTGNDLSRSLGWGPVACSIEKVQEFLQKVDTHGQSIFFDRWKLRFNKVPSDMKQEFIMFNYFSIGLDAKTCYSFHMLRQNYPGLFKSSLGNKFIYSQIGAADMIVGKNVNLDQICELKVDGKKIEIPQNIKNIVFLNIHSWAGGATNLWNLNENNNNYSKQSMSDNKLEVLGVTSILHLGKVQINIEEPIKIAQGQKIEVMLKGDDEHAIQIDGEPYLLKAPFGFQINLIDQAIMMTHRGQANLYYDSKIFDTLEWAEQNNHINSQQKKILSDRFLGITN